MDKIREMVFDWLCEENLSISDSPRENEEYESLAQSCFYSVISNYISDCPVYTGDIITVVFGYPECVYNFTIEDGKLNKLTPEWVINQ